VPIRRSFAVTDVTGQHGELQVIGGVNYKIEGFYGLCKQRWKTGEWPEHGQGYGVLIPRANLRKVEQAHCGRCSARPSHITGCLSNLPALCCKANAQDLMLRPEIAQSIASDPNRRFAVYPISTIDEGLPILTGMAADDIHRRVRQTLDRFYDITSRGKVLRSIRLSTAATLALRKPLK
jgi:predicted ATP-dependent protease